MVDKPVVTGFLYSDPERFWAKQTRRLLAECARGYTTSFLFWIRNSSRSVKTTAILYSSQQQTRTSDACVNVTNCLQIADTGWHLSQGWEAVASSRQCRQDI